MQDAMNGLSADTYPNSDRPGGRSERNHPKGCPPSGSGAQEWARRGIRLPASAAGRVIPPVLCTRFRKERDAMVRSRSFPIALAATPALLVGGARPAHAAGPVFPGPAPPTDTVVYPTEKGVFLSWMGA